MSAAAVKAEYSVDEPLNREPPVHELVQSFLTEKGGFDRNHGPIPQLDAESHSVRVDGAVKNALSLSINQLKAFPQRSIICALQCAGNRRHTMRTELKEVQGLDWFDGAVMNCKWEGPLLRDVLLNAGLNIEEGDMDDAHVAFACFQVKCQEDDWYGGSIPLIRAMSDEAEVILALKMNGKALTPNHGFPVRVFVPGVAGARSVKWLDRITVQTAESKNFYQQQDYKVLPPEADSAEAALEWWSKVPAVQEMPVNSVIASPKTGSKVEASSDGSVDIFGYALPSGESGPVVKLEVSTDEGQTWNNATLINQEDTGKWAWTLWKAKIAINKGKANAYGVERRTREEMFKDECQNGT